MTIAVWVGYDNADGKRRTLGGGSTGGGVAVPIFEPVIQAVWAHVAPKTALAPPSPEAKRQLACKSIDLESGETQRSGGITECLRVDAKGKVIDTQYRLASRERAYAKHEDEFAAGEEAGPTARRASGACVCSNGAGVGSNSLRGARRLFSGVGVDGDRGPSAGNACGSLQSPAGAASRAGARTRRLTALAAMTARCCA